MGVSAGLYMYRYDVS